MAKKKITLVANMMMRDDDFPYLSHTIPALQEMCDVIIVLHNGPQHVLFDEIAEMLGKKNRLIKNCQQDPADYSKMRNIMLDHVHIGEWVARWDPDELPTGTPGNGAYAIKNLIRKSLQGIYTTVAIQCYHMVRDNLALKIEYGHTHPRFFLKQQETGWHGGVHENIRNPGAQFNTPQVLGMAAIHFSYYSPARLRRKELHYASIPGSGHGPGTLFRNIEAGLRELPPNIEFEASEEWLRMVKELE